MKVTRTASGVLGILVLTTVAIGVKFPWQNNNFIGTIFAEPVTVNQSEDPDDNLKNQKIKPIPVFIEKGIAWLADAQFQNGGWGAGLNTMQHIRDPKAVQIDPATTAFSAMAIIRVGNTLQKGEFSKNLQRSLDYLINMAEDYPAEGPKITDITGTQPQTKLGQNIDVSMCAQFFSRILPLTKHEPELEKRVTAALDKCLRKLENAQLTDGSWTDNAWAPVLQSAMANSALELAQDAGREVDKDVLTRSREYQRSNLDAKTGKVKTEGAAGISLYSITSNQRATAKEAKKSTEILREAKNKGLLPSEADVSVDNLQIAGYSRSEAVNLADAYIKNKKGRELLKDETVLAGFGNNGGEEFLSYMMTSESLVLTGGKDWDEWYRKMDKRLAKIQNPNGSWTGHHCITSPVFSTAAVILTMTADRDVQVLLAEQRRKKD